MKKVLISILALVLALGVALPMATPVRAADYYVNPTESIQAAIDGASSGDTIIVAAGTYSPFTVDSFTGPLTIKSQDAANPAIVKGSQAYGLVNTIIVITDSTDINLTDLDIEGEGLEGGDPETMPNAYAVIYEDATGEVKDCTISPNTAQFSTMEAWGYAHGGHGIGIWHDSNVAVDSCTIKEFGVSGVSIHDGATALVKDNTIIGTVFTREDWSVYQAGISVGSGSDLLSASCTATITGNEIYNVRNTDDTTGSCCYGIILNAYKFYNAAYPESTAHITGNDIHDNSVGINANHASPENAYARYNSIYDNTIDGVLTCSDKLGDFVDFDATNNWWGDASGPYHPDSNLEGLGNRVRSYNALLWQTEGDHVDYDPWLGQQLCALKVAIAELTDEDFTKPKAWSNQREALLNKVDAVCGQIEDGAYRGALNKLEKDIKRAIQRWIVEDEQEALIEYVDAEISILEGAFE